MTPITRLVTFGLLVAYVFLQLVLSQGPFIHSSYAGVRAPPRCLPIYPALCSGTSIVQVTISSHVQFAPTLHRRLTPSSPPRQIPSN